jgi:hypothetical protein
MKYPVGVIKENLFTQGNEFILREEQYIGYYHSIYDKFYTGKTNTNNSEELIVIGEIFKNNTSNEKHKDNINYFIKRINENVTKQVDVNQYNLVKNNPLYTTYTSSFNNINISNVDY